MKRTNRTPPIIAGMTGVNTSDISSFKAVITRAVGPPQGRRFMTPDDETAMPANTSGLIPIRLYNGSMAEIVII
ncbi:hypothetical protein SRABI80_03521 [Peribacillus frigoritolerans]|nr:hypothetical protein SRABI80_03521 [Peribacillus frigoritolerans]